MLLAWDQQMVPSGRLLHLCCDDLFLSDTSRLTEWATGSSSAGFPIQQLCSAVVLDIVCLFVLSILPQVPLMCP